MKNTACGILIKPNSDLEFRCYYLSFKCDFSHLDKHPFTAECIHCAFGRQCTCDAAKEVAIKQAADALTEIYGG